MIEIVGGTYTIEVYVDHEWREFGQELTEEDALVVASSICQKDMFTRPGEPFRDERVQIVTPNNKVL